MFDSSYSDHTRQMILSGHSEHDKNNTNNLGENFVCQKTLTVVDALQFM